MRARVVAIVPLLLWLAACGGSDADPVVYPEWDAEPQAPSGVRGAGGVAVGQGHTCQLGEDGIAVCWGADDAGQLDVPAEPFVAIAAGRLHTCGLTAETRSLRCWGEGAAEIEAALAAWTDLDQLVVDSDVTCVAQRGQSALRCAGDVTVAEPFTVDGQRWDALAFGERLGIGVSSRGRVAVSTGVDWTDWRGESFLPIVAAGSDFVCAVDEAHAVRCVGESIRAQALEYGFAGEAIVALQAGRDHLCGLTGTGRVHCEGDDSWRQQHVPFDAASAWIFSEPTADHTCAGDVEPWACWGRHAELQLVLPGEGPRFRAATVATLATAGPETPYVCGVQVDGDVGCAGLSDAACDGGECVLRTAHGVRAVPGLMLAVGPNGMCRGSKSGDVACASWDADFHEWPAETRWASDLVVGGEFVCGIDVEGVLRCGGDPPVGTPVGQSMGDVTLQGGAEHLCLRDPQGRTSCYADAEWLPAYSAASATWSSDTGFCVASDELLCYARSGESFAWPEAGIDARSVAVWEGDGERAMYACAVRADGEVLCRGNAPGADFAWPDGPYAEVVVAPELTCARRDSGEVVCRDELSVGVVPGLAWSSWAAGGDSVCGLDSEGASQCIVGSLAPLVGSGLRDGRVLALEASSDGVFSRVTQQGTKAWFAEGRVSVTDIGQPVSARPELAIASEGRCELDAKGTVGCVDDSGGVLPDPVGLPALDKLVASPDTARVCGLADDAVACWTLGDAAWRLTADLAYRGVAVGPAATCAVVDAEPSPASQLHCWGMADSPYGRGWTASVPAPDANALGRDAIAEVGVGSSRVCALTHGGTVWCWNRCGDSLGMVPSERPALALALRGERLCTLDHMGELVCRALDPSAAECAPS